MTAQPVFEVTRERGVLVVTPVRGFVSLVDEGVQSEVELIVAHFRQASLKTVVIDMENVRLFGSEMLEIVLEFWKELGKDAGRVALCNLPAPGREVMAISGLDTLCSLYPSKETALQAVRQR